MFQRKRKSGVYVHNSARFKTITKIIFILIISSVIAADSKCKLTSKGTESCDGPRLASDDNDAHETDNTKKLPHRGGSSQHDHHHHHHNKLQLHEMKNSIYKYINDMINTRTSEILANSLNQMESLGNGSDNQPVSEANVKRDMIRIERILEYLDSASDGNATSGRQLDASEGRLFFFKGFKKLMWPLIIGVQVVKTVLLAMFLPSILGSLGKIVGKGLSTVSGFTHQAETVDDLEFKDNTYTSDKEQFNGYTYPQADTSAKNNFASQMYDAATANNNAISRFGMNEQQMYMQPEPSPTTMNKPDEMTASSKKDDFKTFHDIPLSSMLLTNYDPFYSPLLSRLDAVFQQLGLSMGNEQCREKLVCLMYSSPAKFAPYSNLVSAQLSRELNELRKPTSDNPDILRFFKYMRAAKLGQDQANCDENFKLCVDLNENNPAMVTTYNDINKLVQARKI